MSSEYLAQNFNYPQSAYQGYIYVQSFDVKIFYPFRYLHTQLEDIKKATYETILNLGEIDIRPIVVVFPVEYDRLINLPRTRVDSYQYNDFDRMRSFIQPLRIPNLFEMLVIPGEIEGKDLSFTAACFPISEDDKNIINFVVSTKSQIPYPSEGAVYRFGAPFSWDLESDQRGIVRTDIPRALN